MNYPGWIDAYADADYHHRSEQRKTNNAEHDHLACAWIDCFVKRLDQALHECVRRGVSSSTVYSHFPSLTVVRRVMQQIIAAYPHCASQNNEAYRHVLTWLADGVHVLTTKDPFARRGNHDIRTELYARDAIIPVLTAQDDDHNRLDRLVRGLSGLARTLHSDDVSSWEAHGPYDAPAYGEDSFLLMLSFPDLAPRVVWPEMATHCSVAHVRCFLVCHDPVHTLRETAWESWELPDVLCATRQWLVEADGRVLDHNAIDRLCDELAIMRHEHHAVYQDTALREKTLTRTCYQFRKLFARAEMGWRPTSEMVDRVASSPDALFPQQFSSREEHENAYGITYLKRAFAV
jgi:AcrR family transcriptional regulator